MSRQGTRCAIVVIPLGLFVRCGGRGDRVSLRRMGSIAVKLWVINKMRGFVVWWDECN